MAISDNFPFPLISSPGAAAAYFPVRHQLEYGRQLRDELVWCYPIIPGAAYTFQQLAANREWKLSGPPRQVVRALDWLNEAVVRQQDNVDLTGFESLMQVRSLDFLAVGRRMLYVPESGELEYLDPCYTEYNSNTRMWHENLTGRKLKRDEVYVKHTLPLGASGRFTSPLMMILPSAILAWLIREHDTSSLDGRKIREVLLVDGDDLYNTIRTAIVSMVKLYTDPSQSVSQNNVPIAHTEDVSEVPIQERVGKLGLTNIPENFDRSSFTFQFVNEVSAATGLALRQFWNQEQSTNRALEEVQQQRQAQKGPETFIRSEQRLLNRILKNKFSRKMRMAFFEEVDAQSQLVRSQVLLNSAQAFNIFNQAAMQAGDGAKKLSLESLIAWLQADDVLPAELEFELETVMQVSDPDSLVDNPQESDPRPRPGRTMGQGGEAKSMDFLEEGFVTMNSRGEVVDRRMKFYPVEKVLYEAMANDPEVMETVEAESEELTFENMLLDGLRDRHIKFIENLLPSLDLPEDRAKHLSEFDNLTDNDFRFINQKLEQHESEDLSGIFDFSDDQ